MLFSPEVKVKMKVKRRKYYFQSVSMYPRDHRHDRSRQLALAHHQASLYVCVDTAANAICSKQCLLQCYHAWMLTTCMVPPLQKVAGTGYAYHSYPAKITPMQM